MHEPVNLNPHVLWTLLSCWDKDQTGALHLHLPHVVPLLLLNLSCSFLVGMPGILVSLYLKKEKCIKQFSWSPLFFQTMTCYWWPPHPLPALEHNVGHQLVPVQARSHRKNCFDCQGHQHLLNGLMIKFPPTASSSVLPIPLILLYGSHQGLPLLSKWPEIRNFIISSQSQPIKIAESFATIWKEKARAFSQSSILSNCPWF